MNHICKGCEHWHDGKGDRTCLECRRMDRAAGNNKPRRERLLDEGEEELYGDRDYKDELHRLSRIAEYAALLKKNPTQYRTIINMYVSGTSIREIVKTLHISPNKVIKVIRIYREWQSM